MQQPQAHTPHALDFTGLLKNWRKQRKMSQLELSLEAQVSQRHLSWLETGRAKPSRDMVMRLAETLDVPNRERNRLLNLAGFAPLYVQSELGAPTMQVVDDVLTLMLDNHEPYPAIVMDRYWNLKMKNKAADKLLALFGDLPSMLREINDDGQVNIARLSLHPRGLRRFAHNWDEVAPSLFTRLRREAQEQHDPGVTAIVDELAQYVPISDDSPNGPLSPILPLRYGVGEQQLSLISVLSSFGSAQDVTANELKIETFYPADDATTAFFKGG